MKPSMSTEPSPRSRSALLRKRASQLDESAVKLEPGADVRARLAIRARNNLVGVERRQPMAAPLCLTCQSTSCPRGPRCELLTVDEDGTVSITLGRKLSPSALRRMRETGEVLAVAGAQPSWLAAVTFGIASGIGGRLDDNAEEGLFAFVEKIEALGSGGSHKLTTAIFETGVEELYGRFNVLDWPMGVETIDEYLSAIAEQRPKRRLDAVTMVEWKKILYHLKKAAKLAALAAAKGKTRAVEEMMQSLRHAFRAALLVKTLDEPSLRDLRDQVKKDIHELDAEIQAANAAT